MNWTTAPAYLALVLGLVNLYWGVIRPWWRTRYASPSARMDLLNFMRGTEPREEVRVVVTNHGPADMRDIRVEILNAEGQPTSVKALWPAMPIAILHNGESLYLTLDLPIGHVQPPAASIAWKDRRRGDQSRTIELSYHRVV